MKRSTKLTAKTSYAESDSSVLEDDDDSVKDANYKNSDNEDTSNDSSIEQTPTETIRSFKLQNKRFKADESLSTAHLSRDTLSSISSDSKTAADFKKNFDIQKAPVTGSKSKNDKIGVCRLCHSKIKMKQSNTTGLKRHLKRHHIQEYNKSFPTKEISKSRTLTDMMITSLKVGTRLLLYGQGSSHSMRLNK